MRATSIDKGGVVSQYPEMKMIWGQELGLDLIFELRKSSLPLGGIRCVQRADTTEHVDNLKSSQRSTKRNSALYHAH